MNRKKIDMLAQQILFYSDNKVSPSIATSEASDYFRRKGMGGLFVHRSSLSSIGKKLAYKCLGKRYC